MEEKLQNTVEKIVCMWKGEKRKKQNPLRSQSADLLCLRKKETTLLEADVDTVSVIEDGRVQLNHCSYKGVLMAVRIPVIDHLHNRQKDSRKQKLWDQDCKQPANFNMQDLRMQLCFALFFHPG